MADTLDPIRIGDTLTRSYTIYGPDGTTPINLTGKTITFHIMNGSTLREYTTSTGLTVTPLTGKIDVELETDQTILFKPDLKAESFLKVTEAGNAKTKAHRREIIIKQEDLV